MVVVAEPCSTESLGTLTPSSSPIHHFLGMAHKLIEQGHPAPAVHILSFRIEHSLSAYKEGSQKLLYTLCGHINMKGAGKHPFFWGTVGLAKNPFTWEKERQPLGHNQVVSAKVSKHVISKLGMGNILVALFSLEWYSRGSNRKVHF